MKKNCLIRFILLLILIAALSGCACSHEWQAADCLNASFCTKCALVEGDPLGHDFSPATCAAPETCKRCGQTRGDALEHTYGQWEDRDPQMVRTCLVCGDERAEAMDRRTLLLQELEGHWDFQSMIVDGDKTTFDEFPDNFLHFWFSCDSSGNARIFDAQVVREMQVEYLEFTPAGSPDTTDCYTFCITQSNGLVYMMQLNLGDTPTVTYYDFEGNSAIMIQHPELEAILTGTWGGCNRDVVCFLDLQKDRTFTANLANGPVTGTWHIDPVNVHEEYNYSTFRLRLRYEENGSPKILCTEISIGTAGELTEAYLEYINFYFRMDESIVTFARMNPDELGALENTVRNAPTALLGQWNSVSVHVYDQATTSGVTSPVSDMEITFLDNGTFTAVLDREYAGSWTFDNITLSNDSSSVAYYTLVFQGVSDKISASISTQNGNQNLSFSGNHGTVFRTLHLQQMTAEEKAALEAAHKQGETLLLGQWNSTTIYENGNRSINTDYTITFRQDGTFSTTLTEGSTGTWTYAGSSTDPQHNITMQNYNMKLDLFDGQISGFIDNSGYLIIGFHYNGVSRQIYFGQLSAEDLEKVRQAPGLIVGEWSGEEIFAFNEQTEQMELVERTAHQLTVNADGTYASSLPMIPSGTWEFWQVDENGIGYSFDAGDNGYIYRINHEGMLEIWLKEADQIRTLFMTKE